jgi:RNA polymerase sigma factor (sigma-70 family)
MQTSLTRQRFGQAYEKGFHKTVAVLRRRGANPDVAEELAQAAWVRAWERLSDLREEQKLVSWATAIARNLLRDSLRSRRTTDLTSAVAELRISPAVNDAVIDLRGALRRCPERTRQVLETVYLQNDGWSTAALANNLHTTLGALHHRLSRARQSLRKALDVA